MTSIYLYFPRVLIIVVFMLVCLVSSATLGQSELQAWRGANRETVLAALSLGRRAFDAYALHRDVIDPPSGLPTLLQRRAAVFVSAMKNGAPRCCMGTLYPTEPNAAREIISSAVAAAGRDHRFPPIKASELKGLTLIVSVIGSSRPIPEADIHDLDPTRDGLAAKCGDRLGVVLSCETNSVDRMINWARIRAGARVGRHVDYIRLQDVRFVEGSSQPR